MLAFSIIFHDGAIAFLAYRFVANLFWKKTMNKSIEVGTKVRCPETTRIGTVMDKRRGSVCTFAKVLWESGYNKTTWTDIVELKIYIEDGQ